MKFEPGAIITHNPTRSKWIIINCEDYVSPNWMKDSHQRVYDSKRRYVVDAYCLLVGNKPQYWKVGCLDEWVLTDQDMEPTDRVWSVDVQ